MGMPSPTSPAGDRYGLVEQAMAECPRYDRQYRFSPRCVAVLDSYPRYNAAVIASMGPGDIEVLFREYIYRAVVDSLLSVLDADEDYAYAYAREIVPYLDELEKEEMNLLFEEPARLQARIEMISRGLQGDMPP